MSANNQILIKEHKGKWYIFTNVMAESWCDENGEHKNELHLSKASAICDTRDEAYEKALELEKKFAEEYFFGHEYGVQFRYLYKDGEEVKLIE